MAVLGVLLLVPLLIQRWRVFTAVQQISQGRMVRIRWKEGSKRDLPTVVVSDPARNSDYSWSIFRKKDIENKLKGRLLRVFRGHRATSAVVSRPDYAELGGELGRISGWSCERQEN